MLKVSAIQFKPFLAASKYNERKILELTTESFNNESSLVVFPELSTSGYAIKDRIQLENLCINPKRSIFVSDLVSISKKYSGVIVIGIPERDGNHIYNSSLIVDSGVVLGTYRKVNLWDAEMQIFNVPEVSFPVFNTSIGILGVLICYDLWKVDVEKEYRNCAVDVMAVPTNWVVINLPGKQNKTNLVGLRLAQEKAQKQKCIYICADRVGSENGLEFIGGSGIINTEGKLVAGPASSEEGEILTAIF